MTFAKLGLSPTLLDAIHEQGYTSPSPIQQQAIPTILQGQDLIGQSGTGTGKTAAFALPLLEQLNVEHTPRPKYFRALILTPTRELAQQIEANIEQYAKHLPLKTLALYGGVQLAPQKQRLIEGVDIVIATPGRLIDLANQRALRFEQVETLILDEADRMLDMGFMEDLNKIVTRLPEERQNLLFSATLPDHVRRLAKSIMVNPAEVTIKVDKHKVDPVEHWLVTVDKDRKSALLSHLIKEKQWSQALIFIRTKHGAAKLVSQLSKRDISADAIHGDRSQEVRDQILADFKAGNIQYLVSTDVSARGIDIDQLPVVINYDLPNAVDDFIHRVGRTGRAGASGEVVSLISYDDFKSLCSVERRLNKVIERRELEEFTPRKVVPISKLDFVPKNPNTKDHGLKDSRPKKSNAGKKPNIKVKHHSSDTAKPKKDHRGEATQAKPFNPWDHRTKK